MLAFTVPGARACGVGGRAGGATCVVARGAFVARGGPAKRPRVAVAGAERAAVRVLPTAVESGVLPFVGEALKLLASTSIVVPLFRRLGLSPILGFLLAGVVLGPNGLRLVKDVEDITELAEFGVLFLLFEMGLQLNLDRLQKLRKYVFGLGALQVASTSAVLGVGAYGLGASFNEAVVIGCALSLSSSAFVLQVLSEKGERQSRAGVASYGVLLLQDLATIPALVFVPLLSSSLWVSPSQMGSYITSGGEAALRTFAMLNVIVLAGGFVLRKVFAFVAESKSSEAFTSTVLLTVLGTAWCTAELGLPMTLGSFIAGVLLAESSFRSRIMVDMEPFRGLLLGLFFITTGMSMDPGLFLEHPLIMAFLVMSLIFVKTGLTTLAGLPVGLSLAESLRVGLLTSQGGEFSFVLFALANKLGFLSDEVNSFLITTVVTSMALTPALYEVGCKVAPYVDRVVKDSGGQATPEALLEEVRGSSKEAFVLIFGYGPVGQVVGRMLSRKFIRWVAVDISMNRVRLGAENDVPVIYGDSVHPAELLEANNLPTPSAFVVTHSVSEVVEDCLSAVRAEYPDRPVYVRSKDVDEQKKLLGMGALALFPETLETSLSLGAEVLKAFGTIRSDVSAIKKQLREDGDVDKSIREYESWTASMRSPADDLAENDVSPTPAIGGGTEGASAASDTVHSVLSGSDASKKGK